MSSTPAGKLYWIDINTGAIRVGNLGGSGSPSILFTDTNTPVGLALDSASGKVYWSDFNSGAIGGSGPALRRNLSCRKRLLVGIGLGVARRGLSIAPLLAPNRTSFVARDSRRGQEMSRHALEADTRFI